MRHADHVPGCSWPRCVRKRKVLRWAERSLRALLAATVLAASVALLIGGSALILRPGLAYADGAVPCGPRTQPPFPDQGFCADYNGQTTWYGTYGPGFPTAQGFGLCGEPPASGGAFPVPSYNYVQGGAPAGAGGDWAALGFAFSQGLAAGWWNGQAGRFTAAQAAAASKLLYDTVVWGTPIPSMDPGVLAAFDEFDNWYLQARGTSADPPQMSAGLTSNSASFTGSATDLVHLEFSGTHRPMVGEGVLLSIDNGTFNAPNGPTTAGLSTDANGNVLIPIFATTTASVRVTIQSVSAVGRPGLSFFHATRGDLGAQILVGFSPSSVLGETQALAATGTPPATVTGTLSVEKTGDDTAYYGLANAVFDVVSGATTVATLTTDASGATVNSSPLPVGTYTVHERVPPTGYQVAPDQTVTVSADTNTVVHYTGMAGDHITPASVTIHKVDAQGGGPLAGAVFDVAYSTSNTANFDQSLGQCTTDASGECAPSGNDGAGLRPGHYEIREVSAPPGYYLDPASATQTVFLAPGQAGAVTFADFLLGSLTLRKSGDNTAYTSVQGAVFSVSGPAPSVGVVGTLTVGADGLSNTVTGLLPGSYTITETAPPSGYSPVAPVIAAVADGTATTVIDVTDHVIPASVALLKVDRETNAPLAGAVFDVAYDPNKSGTYSADLGLCTTAASGACAIAGNDGASALLPGNYEVTEVSPPPGHVLDPSGNTKLLTLTPGATGSVTFSDPLLVPAAFVKTASGNVDTSIVTLQGAQFEVHQGTASGSVVASCTTDATGRCTTNPALLSGGAYCWTEVAAPTGLSGGAHGCFTADNAQATQPIAVDDAGNFVVVAAKKVDAADPSITLPGAVFDLYRRDGGNGPGVIPTAPSGTASFPGQTWMARATSGSDGVATFPLQFPDFAYCVVEEQAPANFEASGTPQCTDTLVGSVATPALVTFLTFADTPHLITVVAHKFNTAVPDTSIPGATYDLYVEGTLPPSNTSPVAPSDAALEPGDAWFARGTSDGSGNLTFTVPAGYAWCLAEHSAPVDYVPDLALHCSSVLTASSPVTASAIALPETVAPVYVSAHKYNSLQPGTVIAGATYALFAQGPMPAGHAAVPVPPGVSVPSGETYFAQGTTDDGGLLSFSVPAGSSWCLQELSAPPEYQPDSGTHCTGVVTNQTSAAAASLALPELPAPGPGPGPLAFTGGPGWWLPAAGLFLMAGGLGLLVIKRRAERTGPSALASDLVDGVDELAQAREMPFVEPKGEPG